MSRYRVVAAPGVMLALVVLVVIPFADADTGFLESIEVQPDTTESPESTGPEFSEVPNNVTVVLGQPATLRCSATGNPPPRVVWHSKKTGRVKPDASLGIKVDEEGIHWERVGKEEEGLYRCTAKSTAGTRHSEFAYLKVLGVETVQVVSCAKRNHQNSAFLFLAGIFALSRLAASQCL